MGPPPRSPVVHGSGEVRSEPLGGRGLDRVGPRMDSVRRGSPRLCRKRFRNARGPARPLDPGPTVAIRPRSGAPDRAPAGDHAEAPARDPDADRAPVRSRLEPR
jgi:hypothetical protein